MPTEYYIPPKKTPRIPRLDTQDDVDRHQALEDLILQALEHELIKGQNSHTQACMIAAFIETAGYTKS